MRRLAVSNIAWKPEEDQAVGKVLREHGIDAIETVMRRNPQEGFEVIAVQALFNGTEGLNIFEDPKAVLRYLGVHFAYNKWSKTKFVFGSPKQREHGNLSNENAFAHAARFFESLGDLADQYGATVCIEPVPKEYGCTFINTTKQAAELVEAACHPAIRLQLDTAAMTLNDDNVARIVKKYGRLVGHVHISEPGLREIGDSETDHVAIARALSSLPEEMPFSIEMAVGSNVEPAVEFVQEVYGCA